MKVSVLIPVFNKAHCLERCIRSIVNQTYKDLEILVYDDGSTDDSIGVAYAIKDKRIRIIQGGHNAGISHGRNVLMREATGKMSAWQDADDYSNPWRIESQVAVCKFCGVVTSRVYRTWIRKVSGGLDTHRAPNPIGINYRRGTFCATLFPSRPVIPFHLGMELEHELLWCSELGRKYGFPAVVCAAYYYYSGEEQPFRTTDLTHPHNRATHYWASRGLWKITLKHFRAQMAKTQKAICEKPPIFTAHDIPPYIGSVTFKTKDVIAFQDLCQDSPFSSEATCVYL